MHPLRRGLVRLLTWRNYSLLLTLYLSAGYLWLRSMIDKIEAGNA